MSPAEKRVPPTSALSPRNWRSTRRRLPPAETPPRALDRASVTAYDQIRMFGSSDRGASARSSRPAPPERTTQSVVVRCAVLGAAVLAYWASFGTLHGLIANRAFLLGQGIC